MTDGSDPAPSVPGDDADLCWPAPIIETVRLMGEHTVEVPLWSERGLMFAAPESVVSHLGVSTELATDLAAWADAWHTRSGEPDHDAEAAALIRRLREETGRRYNFVYQP
nr:hypothetical protein [uncultured Nocardioides sp.]